MSDAQKEQSFEMIEDIGDTEGTDQMLLLNEEITDSFVRSIASSFSYFNGTVDEVQRVEGPTDPSGRTPDMTESISNQELSILSLYGELIFNDLDSSSDGSNGLTSPPVVETGVHSEPGLIFVRDENRSAKTFVSEETSSLNKESRPENSYPSPTRRHAMDSNQSALKIRSPKTSKPVESSREYKDIKESGVSLGVYPSIRSTPEQYHTDIMVDQLRQTVSALKLSVTPGDDLARAPRGISDDREGSLSKLLVSAGKEDLKNYWERHGKSFGNTTSLDQDAGKVPFVSPGSFCEDVSSHDFIKDDDKVPVKQSPEVKITNSPIPKMDELIIKGQYHRQPLRMAKVQSGFFSWIRTNKGIQKLVKHAKTSINTLLTIMDPGMISFLEDLDPLLTIYVLTSDSAIKSSVKQGFMRISGFNHVLYITSVDVNCDDLPPQPVGYPSGLDCAGMLITSARECRPSLRREVMIVIVPVLVEISSDRWHSTAILMLDDPVRKLSLEVCTQTTPVPNEYVNQAMSKPNGYLNDPKCPAGIGTTVGEAISFLSGVSSNDWQKSLTDMSFYEQVEHAASLLAGMYRNYVESWIDIDSFPRKV